MQLVGLLVACCTASTLWPLPQHVQLSGSERSLSSDFRILYSGASARLGRGVQRYANIIGIGSTEDVGTVRGLWINVTSTEEGLSIDTAYNYSLTLEADSDYALVRAQTIYGALYGLETFSQLVWNGSLAFEAIVITDAPAFRHRGLMLDTGRRFFPVSTVQNALDAMSYSKMNVLHFHLSDFCRFAVESKVYPELTAVLTGSMGGFYTQTDIGGLIQYAADRGIRVIPEFDLPGHSKGMSPLSGKGLNYCAVPNIQLYDDPNNQTLTTLKAIITEMSSLFPDQVFNVGCDETSVVGKCTLNNIGSLEHAVLEHIQSLGKTPMGWEEVLFSTHAATNQTIVDAWEKYTSGQVTSAGYYSVESSDAHFYLTSPSAPWSNFWADIAPGFTPAQQALLLGGEVSCWTDFYCYETECGAWGDIGKLMGKPPGAALFPPWQNDAFARSIGGNIWPRAAIGAGSFWNYQSSLDPTSQEFVELIQAHNARLASRSIFVCPNNCTCDEVSACGTPFIPPCDVTAQPEEGDLVLMYPCRSENAQNQAWSFGSDGVVTLRSNASLVLSAGPQTDPTTGNPALQVCARTSGDASQQFTFASKNLVNEEAGDCVDITHTLDYEDPGAAIELYACNKPASKNQEWSFDAASGRLTTALNGYCVSVCAAEP